MRRDGALAIARSFVVAALHPLALTPALALAFASLAATGPLGCVRPLRMCTMSGDCGALSSCVAGRCVTHGAVPAIATAHRMLFEPVELGYVRRDRDGAREAPAAPAVATLGPGGGRVFMRFAVPIAPEVTIVEAYVLVDRILSVDADPAPIAVHLARVADPWDSRSLSWALQPRIEELGSPVTRVLPSAGAVVRLDARLLVERWRLRRRSDELGIAIVAAEDVPSGPDARPGSNRGGMAMAFALAPREPLDSLGSDRGDGLGAAYAPSAPYAGQPALAPRLELYLR
jgi:hypothetical protein